MVRPYDGDFHDDILEDAMTTPDNATTTTTPALPSCPRCHEDDNVTVPVLLVEHGYKMSAVIWDQTVSDWTYDPASDLNTWSCEETYWQCPECHWQGEDPIGVEPEDAGSEPLSVNVYTNAPQAYDYETTVLRTVNVPGHTSFKHMTSQSPFRLVALDSREEGYYAEYQMARYKSGGYLVLTPKQWDDWRADGTIIGGYGAADEPMS